MRKKTVIRAALSLILAATALVMALHTLAVLRARPVTESGAYLLAASSGQVAVYDRLDRRRALEVTDIALDSLREHDRQLIEKGLPVDGREALMELLEDLGS
jgi:hypothetical protein